MPRSTQPNAKSNPTSAPQAASGGGLATETLVTRVPILAADGSLFAYELIGQSQADPSLDTTGDAVRVRCLLHAVLNEIGLNELVADKRLIIPVALTNVQEEDYVVLPAERTILHVSTSTVPASLCASIRDEGYMVARSANEACDDESLACTDILRFDISAASTPAVSETIAKARSAGVRLLADNVDTAEAREAACALGAELMSGRHFFEPEVKTGSLLSGVKALKLQFLAALNEKPMNFERVETAIKCNASLTINLLRYLNSASLGVREKIKSVGHAIRLLGEKPLRTWGSLVAMNSLAEDKPKELLVTALIRSRFCEELASVHNLPGEPIEYHLAGLLSVIDALTDMPIGQAIDALPIEQSVRDAILGDESQPTGCALALAKACEVGAWASVASLGASVHVTQRQIANHYYQAVTWTNRFFSTMNEAN